MTNEHNAIPLITQDNPAAHSGDVVGENVATLMSLFPQIVTDGKIDFEALRQLLGEAVEVDDERYGLNWNGKSKARAHALTPTLATLRPAKNDSVNWDATKNILIEGDNLEVLKTLRKAYAGKVKLIYIDPPYNTGKDFVYPDNYKNSLSNYMELTGQRNAVGAQLTSNKESSGRFHTDWLNMMYPRLMLARDLLRDDGLIFVSIGDAEIASLRAMLETVFGAENFEGHIHWRRRHNQPNDPTKMIGLVAEHIVCFAKDSKKYKASGVGKVPLTGSFSNPDNDPRGDWATKPWKTGSDQNGSRYDITLPSGDVLNEEWMGDENKYRELLKDDRIIFPDEGRGAPRKKYFEYERQEEGQSATNWWSHEDVGHNQGANSDMAELFDDTKNIFSNPKPITLIQRVIQLANVKDTDIVMDFFAGSGTTAHAVIAQNAIDGGRRRFIVVQLPEKLRTDKAEQQIGADFCDKLGKPLNIAELTKERVRRAGAKVESDYPTMEVDTGFRVYKLDTSNLKPWCPDSNDLEASLLDAVSNILHDRTEEDLLAELMLKTGIDLATFETTKLIADNTVYALGGGVLIVCLADIDDGNAEQIAHGLADWQAELDPAGQTTFYFKDMGFSSASAKANVNAILRQRLGDKIAKLASI